MAWPADRFVPVLGFYSPTTEWDIDEPFGERAEAEGSALSAETGCVVCELVPVEAMDAVRAYIAWCATDVMPHGYPWIEPLWQELPDELKPPPTAEAAPPEPGTFGEIIHSLRGTVGLAADPPT